MLNEFLMGASVIFSGGFYAPGKVIMTDMNPKESFALIPVKIVQAEFDTIATAYKEMGDIGRSAVEMLTEESAHGKQ